MATQPIYENAQPDSISVREYLSTSYRPDCEYVDGRIEERNVGEFEHGYLQALIAGLFNSNGKAWGVRASTDVRTQIGPTRFRIPDVTVQRSSDPRESIIRHPQLIAVEILSPEDRVSRLQERIDEYLGFGIEHIWVFDPVRRTASIVIGGELRRVQTDEMTVPGTPIRVVLSELFARMDEN